MTHQEELPGIVWAACIPVAILANVLLWVTVARVTKRDNDADYFVVSVLLGRIIYCGCVMGMVSWFVMEHRIWYLIACHTANWLWIFSWILDLLISMFSLFCGLLQVSCRYKTSKIVIIFVTILIWLVAISAAGIPTILFEIKKMEIHFDGINCFFVFGFEQLLYALGLTLFMLICAIIILVLLASYLMQTSMLHTQLKRKLRKSNNKSKQTNGTVEVPQQNGFISSVLRELTPVTPTAQEMDVEMSEEDIMKIHKTIEQLINTRKSLTIISMCSVLFVISPQIVITGYNMIVQTELRYGDDIVFGCGFLHALALPIFLLTVVPRYRHSLTQLCRTGCCCRFEDEEGKEEHGFHRDTLHKSNGHVQQGLDNQDENTGKTGKSEESSLTQVPVPPRKQSRAKHLHSFNSDSYYDSDSTWEEDSENLSGNHITIPGITLSESTDAQSNYSRQPSRAHSMQGSEYAYSNSGYDNEGYNGCDEYTEDVPDENGDEYYQDESYDNHEATEHNYDDYNGDPPYQNLPPISFSNGTGSNRSSFSNGRSGVQIRSSSRKGHRGIKRNSRYVNDYIVDGGIEETPPPRPPGRPHDDIPQIQVEEDEDDRPKRNPALDKPLVYNKRYKRYEYADSHTGETEDDIVHIVVPDRPSSNTLTADGASGFKNSRLSSLFASLRREKGRMAFLDRFAPPNPSVMDKTGMHRLRVRNAWKSVMMAVSIADFLNSKRDQLAAIEQKSNYMEDTDEFTDDDFDL